MTCTYYGAGGNPQACTTQTVPVVTVPSTTPKATSTDLPFTGGDVLGLTSIGLGVVIIGASLIRGAVALVPESSIDGVVGDDGSVTIQVANKRIARLVQLGVHVERAARQKALRRRMTRQSRRKNRSK